MTLEHSEIPDQTALFKDSAYMETLRIQMQKFAELQLKDAHLAEDAVQEALIGAMKNAQSFRGKSAYKTWVFAILKNKITDILRKRYHKSELTNTSLNTALSDDESDLPNLFDDKGHWYKEAAPCNWSNPENNVNNDAFWLVFEACLEHLPSKQGKVFMMREFLDLSTEVICAEEKLSISNLHVLLYRARMRLQKCLEMRWFAEEVDYA